MAIRTVDWIGELSFTVIITIASTEVRTGVGAIAASIVVIVVRAWEFVLLIVVAMVRDWGSRHLLVDAHSRD